MSRLKLNRNLTIMCVTISVAVLGNFTWYPLLPLHLRSLGANDWEIGVTFTLMGIARTLFAVVGGALADRIGRRLMLTLPHFACVLLYFVAAMMTNWVALVVVLVLLNALNALNGPAFSAIIAESVSEDRVAHAFSATETALLFGLIAGPLAGAALVSQFSISMLMGLYGFVLLAVVSVRFFGIQESERPPRVTAPKLRAAIDARVMWYIAANSLIIMAFGICFGPYFTILARDAWQRNESEINLLFAVGNIASLGGIWLGRRADRWGNLRVMMLGLLVSAFGMAGWGIATSWEWGLAPMALTFLFSEGAFIALQAISAQITTRETRASVLGFVGTVSGVIGGLGPTLAAGLIVWGGNAVPFIASGVMCLGAVAASRQIEKLPRSKVASAQAE